MTSPSLQIGQYWDSEDVPDYLEDLFETFRARNPEFEHRVFSEAAAERFIAERFGGREAAAFRACAVPAMQADYFRCCFVLACGGVYADADYRCVGSLRPLLEGSEGGELFLRPTVHPLNGRQTMRMLNGFFAFRDAGHPFLRVALDVATHNMEARLAEQVWAAGDNTRAAIWLTVGPGIFTGIWWMHELGSFEAFLDLIVGSEAEPFGPHYCEAIGCYERIGEAFAGVRVSPFESMFAWIDHPEAELPYKQTASHWHNVTTAIFR